jgi:hypothetical protein
LPRPDTPDEDSQDSLHARRQSRGWRGSACLRDRRDAVALQLIAGRDEIWLPRRWRRLDVAGSRQQRFLNAVMRMIRRLEPVSRPRLRFLFGRPLSNVVFGTLVVGCPSLPS